MKVFSFITKYPLFLLQLYSNCICMVNIRSVVFLQRNLQFYKFSYVILNFIIHMLEENLQFYRKMSLLPFFNDILFVFVCVSLYLWKLHQISSNLIFFLQISLILYEISYTNSSFLIENVFTSFFNYVIIIFVCQSFYLRFFKKIFNFISYPM